MFRDPDDANDPRLALVEAGGDHAAEAGVPAPGEAPGGFKTWLGMTEDKEIWEIAVLLTRKYGAQAIRLAQARARQRAAADDLASFVIWHGVKEAAEELLRPSPRAGEWRV
jgi:hypothetical protein